MTASCGYNQNVSYAVAGVVYSAGFEIRTNVNFSQPVTLVSTAQSLLLGLDGGQTRTAEYVSGDVHSHAHLCIHDGAGDLASDLDYAGAGALQGNVSDFDGNMADLILPVQGLPGGPGLVRLYTPSYVTGVTSQLPASTYPVGYRIVIVVNFSAPVTYSGATAVAGATA